MTTDWITKTDAMGMGLTQGQFSWRLKTGDIMRHPEDKRLYRRHDVERLVKFGRSAQKPLGDRPARLAIQKPANSAKPPQDEIKRRAKVINLRASLALQICAQLMQHDTKLGRQVSGLFRTTPEIIAETARSFY